MKANARSGLLANWKIEELYVLACSLVTRFIAHILIRKVLPSTHSCQQHLEGLPKPLLLSNHLLIWTIFVRNLTNKRIPFFPECTIQGQFSIYVAVTAKGRVTFNESPNRDAGCYNGCNKKIYIYVNIKFYRLGCYFASERATDFLWLLTGSLGTRDAFGVL